METYYTTHNPKSHISNVSDWLGTPGRRNATGVISVNVPIVMATC